MSVRARIEAAIEALIALLDALDGDPDLEPHLAGWQLGGCDDREMDVGDEGEAGADDDLCDTEWRAYG